MNSKDEKITEQTLGSSIIDVLDNNDIIISCIGEYTSNEPYIEMEWYSPEGEDFNFIVSMKSPEDFVSSFREYASDFDAEEHAAEWYENRNTNGVPQSLTTLLEDANAIKEFLESVSKELSQLDLEQEQSETKKPSKKHSIERD